MPRISLIRNTFLRWRETSEMEIRQWPHQRGCYRWPAELDETSIVRGPRRTAECSRPRAGRSIAMSCCHWRMMEGLSAPPRCAGEEPAADRLLAMLSMCGSGVSPRDWLRNSFFEERRALFHQRPFICHIWNRRKLLESLT